MNYLDTFVHDVKYNEKTGTDPDFEYRLSHKRAVEHANAIERLRALEDGYPAAKMGEHISDTAKRVHELGFKEFVHNDRVHKVRDYIPYVDWKAKGLHVDDGNYLGQVVNGNGVVIEALDGFGSRAGAALWATQRLEKRKSG